MNFWSISLMKEKKTILVEKDQWELQHNAVEKAKLSQEYEKLRNDKDRVEKLKDFKERIGIS